MINFYEMLEKQKVLDKAINHVGDRDETKIRLSMIAEIIEFQETLEETHKTWKKSKFTREDKLEEFVDIFFFWCQLMLVYDESVENDNNKKLNLFYNDNDFWLTMNINELVLCLVNNSVYNSVITNFTLIKLLGAIAKKQGFTDDKINEMHDKKFRKNLERIGVEWA